MDNWLSKYKVPLICIFLAGSTFACYRPVLTSDFINMDDLIYVTDNEHTQTGLSRENVAWAFGVGRVAYWHPLTWLSHMLDCQLFGLRPGLHHLTSLIIHIANSLLLFLVLKRMTGAIWTSAFVAAVFALHPLNVDSVAWVAERKNVLSTLFWLLTLWAYVGYVQHGRAIRYLAVLVLLTLGLLAKPMLVTLPFVMLLLDHWPLGRLRLAQAVQARAGKGRKARSVFGLVLEKIPFFALSGISVFLSYMSLRRLGITASTETVPVKLRLCNAAISYAGYLSKILCPRKLAVFYPYPMEIAIWRTIGALVVLACVSIVLIWVFRRRPYLTVGWLWFLGTLVPVIGLVQAGLWPAIADRWAYVPMIGLLVVIGWGARDIAAAARCRPVVPAALAGACLCILSVGTYIQVGYWRNSKTLFEHALDVTADNYIAHVNLGNAILKESGPDAAVAHYLKAVTIHPGFADAHYSLGVVFALQDRYDKAVAAYRAALRVDHDHFKARLRLADALARSGKLDQAVTEYGKVMREKPDDVEVLNNFALALVDMKRTDEALALLYKALSISPDSVEVLNNIGNTLAAQQKFDLAAAQLERALKLDPEFVQTYYNLAGLCKHKGQLDSAVEYYQRALQLSPDDPDGHYGLALVLAQQDRPEQAIAHYQEAIRLNPDFARAYYHLGLLYADRKHTDKAIEQFRQVLRIHPNDAEMHCNLGTLLMRNGSLDRAIEEFRTALRLDPNLARASEQLQAALKERSAGDSP